MNTLLAVLPIGKQSIHYQSQNSLIGSVIVRSYLLKGQKGTILKGILKGIEITLRGNLKDIIVTYNIMQLKISIYY